MASVAIGASLGLLFIVPTILWSRSRGFDSWLFAATLSSLPLFYMLFGLLASGDGIVMQELLYGVPFLVAGVAALVAPSKFPMRLLGTLWIAHSFYDLFHDRFFINDGVWALYPVFCAVIDVTVGLYLLAAPGARVGSSPPFPFGQR